MKALVTGATGFIGSNLVRELLEDGLAVRVLVRPGSDRRAIAGLPVETVEGDLRDGGSLTRALDGCDFLFHAAAQYSFWTPDPKLIYETNVGGTRRLLEAARATGIRKVVYTSSESTVAVPGPGALGTEDGVSRPEELAGHYKRSKLEAERVALEACRSGLPVVVVNPTTPIGPWDLKPTPTGRIILDFLNRRMPAYVNTGLNVVHVKDVARGHLLALRKGRVGERYLLGNRNLTLKQILDMLARITGLPAPRLRIPLLLALFAGYMDELLSGRVRGSPPRIPVAAVKTARHFRHFDCSKAVRELGLPQTPVEKALEDAVRWFRENGYAS